MSLAEGQAAEDSESESGSSSSSSLSDAIDALERFIQAAEDSESERGSSSSFDALEEVVALAQRDAFDLMTEEQLRIYQDWFEELWRRNRRAEMWARVSRDEIDDMTEEELLLLQDSFEENWRRMNPPGKLTAVELARLPTYIVPPEGLKSELSEEATTCSVCLECHTAGQELKTLPCLHWFHSECIDEWLLSDSPSACQCPMCRTDLANLCCPS
eukprot:TRINITY_DN38162_c0_g1_i1.p1 TRINITY_DN38162_c0_g1~~TRINITY_DN38162_c0_g1_i1.p1  ORF type:complete len:215 (-),score=53.32 TRINITY_DN38162_c0_g1_i1:132-776(-)